MMLLLIGLGMVVLGGALALLVAGVRGRKMNDHPRCKKCSFDLHGVYPGVEVCPECGADVTRNNAVARGIRARRPVFIAIGSVVLLLAAALGTTGIYAGATGFDWNTIKPVWVLLRETDSQDIARRDAAIGEFVRRVLADELSQEATARVLDAALDHQADTLQPWNPAWGGVFQVALIDDLVTAEQQRRFLRHLLAHEIEPRLRIRAGDRLPIERRPYTRAQPLSGAVTWSSSPPQCVLRTEYLGALLDGEHEVPMHGGVTESVGLWGTSGFESLGSMRSPVESWVGPFSEGEIEPGEHSLTVYLGVRASFTGTDLVVDRVADFSDIINLDRPWEHVDETFDDGILVFAVPIDVPFTVVNDPVDSYRPLKDPTLRDEILGCFGHPRVDITHHDDTTLVNLWLPLDERPSAQLAFDAYLRDGDRSWAVSTVTWCNPEAADFSSGVWLSAEWRERVVDFPGVGPPARFTERATESLLGFDAEYVDIVLVPSEAAAVDSLHVFEPWHGELVFEHVPVTIRNNRGRR